MWGDMSLWNVQGPLLHSGDHIVPHILTVDYTFKLIAKLLSHYMNVLVKMDLDISLALKIISEHGPCIV